MYLFTSTSHSIESKKAKWSTYIFANKVIKYFFVAMEISALGSFKATPCVKVQQLYLRSVSYTVECLFLFLSSIFTQKIELIDKYFLYQMLFYTG